jgi:cobalt-zinc-cadmium efflux system membrane fusion protein
MSIPLNRTTAALLAGAALAAGAAGLMVGRASAPRPAPEAPKDDKASDGGVVALSPAGIQAAGIELVAVAPRSLAEEVLAQGTVVASPDGQAVLAARADGALVRLFKRLGDPVRAGETVALIQSREASAISADRAKAAAELAAARAKYARERRLFDEGVTARQDLEAARADAGVAEAEARRAQQAAAAARVASGGTLAVTSPVSGRISAAPAELGAFVAAGAEIFRVTDARRVEVRASAPGADADLVSVGDPAVLEVDGRRAEGVVRSITPGLDPATRTGTVLVTPLGGGELLRPGAAVQVRIASRRVAGRPGLVLPEEAVQQVDGRDVVFVRTATGFRIQPVTVGARGAGQVSIAAGLRSGDKVASRNAFLLKAELQKPASEEDGE